jgi:Raf kinase inhibitor-like YbhB/YbcL family protein
MELHSTSFGDGQEIPQKHGKKAQNVSPELSWTGAPTGTRSFAVSMRDNDPVARGYLHWLLVGIRPDSAELAEDSSRNGLPVGARELEPYAGPFPPSGTHEYEFTLYALDLDLSDPDAPGVESLGLTGGMSLERFVQKMEGHVLATAGLLGTFPKVRA